MDVLATKKAGHTRQKDSEQSKKAGGCRRGLVAILVAGCWWKELDKKWGCICHRGKVLPPQQQSECIFHRGMFVCLAASLFAYFMRAGLVCGKMYLFNICCAFVNAQARQEAAESS